MSCLSFLRQEEKARPTNLVPLTSGCLLHTAWLQNDWPMALLFLDFGFEHNGRGPGNSAIFTHAPEMQGHKDAGNQRDGDAMPDVGTEKRVGIHDRSA